jgi:hypothetical protein
MGGTVKKLKARKVTRYEMWVHHNDGRQSKHRLSMTEKQYRHVNAMPDGEEFFLSNFYAVHGGNCRVIKRNGELYRQPFPGELAQQLDQMSTTGPVQ